MKITTTWILVANGGNAQIFQTEGRSGELAEVEGMSFVNETPPARDIMADRQGRTFDSAGSGRHAMEYPSDPAEISETRFAGQLGEVLQNALDKHRFDELSVAAAPAMLAKLRKALSPQVCSVIRAEIDKDYTKIAKNELADYLRRSKAID